LADRVDSRGGVDLRQMDTAAEHGLDLPHGAGNENHVALEAVFFEKAEILGRPYRRLKTGKAGVGHEIGFLRMRDRRYER
jgi:hypothetical protein